MENKADKAKEARAEEMQPDVIGETSLESKTPATEKDIDEIIHTDPKIVQGSTAKHDPDEAIHQVHHEKPSPNNEVDVDDLLHR